MSRTGFWPRAAAGVAALALLAAGCSDDDDGGDEGAAESTTTSGVEVPDGIVIGAGINDPEDATIAVLEFLPEEVSVEVGETVTWEWEGAEPHSVTFLAPGQAVPDPAVDESLFPPTPPTGPYDGETLVNSGLQPLGPTAPAPFEMTFSTAGEHDYVCVIHPGMTGTVTVVEEGGEVDTPEDVAEDRAEDTAEYLAEGRAAKAELVDAEPVRTTAEDGSSTWTIEMGTTTEHVDVLAFAPTPADVKAGDTVTFVNNSKAPHTASFFGTEAEPIQNPLDERVGPPAPGPSPQALNSTDFFNTGLLPPDVGPPPQARSFSFTVPEPGTYAYVCILHAPSQMIGTISAT